MPTSLRKFAIALVALVAAAVAIPIAASNAAEGDSTVTVIHGIPGVPVDVYVNDGLAIGNFLPTDQAGPLTLAPAAYRVAVYAHTDSPPASAAPRRDAAVISQTVTVPGKANVSLIANLDSTGTPVLSAFVNDVSPVAAGQARVVVRHLAQAPTVDVLVNGTRALTNLAHGQEQSTELPAGTYDFGVAVAPDGPTVLNLAGTSLAAGSITVVYATGSATAEPSTLGAQLQSLAAEGATPASPATASPTTSPAAAEPATPAPAAPHFTG
jgi:hypothetical protein